MAGEKEIKFELLKAVSGLVAEAVDFCIGVPNENVAVGTILLCPTVVVVVVVVDGFKGSENPELAGVVLDSGALDVPNANVNDFVAVSAVGA